MILYLIFFFFASCLTSPYTKLGHLYQSIEKKKKSDAISCVGQLHLEKLFASYSDALKSKPINESLCIVAEETTVL